PEPPFPRLQIQKKDASRREELGSPVDVERTAVRAPLDRKVSLVGTQDRTGLAAVDRDEPEFLIGSRRDDGLPVGRDDSWAANLLSRQCVWLVPVEIQDEELPRPARTLVPHEKKPLAVGEPGPPGQIDAQSPGLDRFRLPQSRGEQDDRGSRLRMPGENPLPVGRKGAGVALSEPDRSAVRSEEADGIVRADWPAFFFEHDRPAVRREVGEDRQSEPGHLALPDVSRREPPDRDAQIASR